MHPQSISSESSSRARARAYMHAHNKSGSTARLQGYIGNLAAWSCFPIKVSCGGSVSKKQESGWAVCLQGYMGNLAVRPSSPLACRESWPGCKVILETLQPGHDSLSKSAAAALSRKSRNRAGRSACKVIWETLQSDRPAHRRCKFAGLPLQRPTPGARSVTITTDHCALIRPSIVTTSIEPIP